MLAGDMTSAGQAAASPNRPDASTHRPGDIWVPDQGSGAMDISKVPEAFQGYLLTDPTLIDGSYPRATETILTDLRLATVLLPAAGREVRVHTTHQAAVHQILTTGLRIKRLAGADNTSQLLFDNTNPYTSYDTGIINNPFREAPDDVVKYTNAQKLAREGHLGLPYKIIVDRPAITKEDIEAARYSHHPTAAHANAIPDDPMHRVIPAKYIRGYLNMETGVYFPNEHFEDPQSG